ncbi:MAG: hypothetical protein KME64_28545 [Scytonematopsis contorta HA4267-MV1]|jgi:hypothetical protein|nr:hypothetical protein [Scytonematopsis contorta HA4267-MV1]
MKLIFVMLGFSLVLSLVNQAVKAQPLPSTSIPDEAIPDYSQPSSTPTSNPPSTEKAKPRSLGNYIGVGGTIGVSGSGEGLSHGGLTIINKRDLNDFLSVRGTTVFGGDQNDSTLALTVNFPVRTSSGQIQLVPFLGGGMLVRSQSNFENINIRGLLTAGIDVPLSRRFTATTMVNVGLFQNTEVGVQLGLGYNF